VRLRLLVRTWNLYHGRTFPPSGDLHLERMVRLITADAPDVVALQEVPLWATRKLEAWSGMTAASATAMPARLGPLARRVTDLDPVRFRSAFTGQANALLVNPHFDVGEHRRLVLNPGLRRRRWLLGREQRRVCQALAVEARGVELVVANLHASTSPRLATREAVRAADFLADAERCILCGDFNVPNHSVRGFSEPIDGIDQVLVRGLSVDRRPEAWPKARRSVGARVLSDHAPVEAVIG
jgi:endonuclease/exonuclease/phosphatase family metal-dependent hydrolase